MSETIRSKLSSSTQREFASAMQDGIVAKSDSTELNFNCLYIEPGVTGTIIVGRDENEVNVSSPAYTVEGPQVLCVAGVRVMDASSYSGGNVIWQRW